LDLQAAVAFGAAAAAAAPTPQQQQQQQQQAYPPPPVPQHMQPPQPYGWSVPHYLPPQPPRNYASLNDIASDEEEEDHF